MFLAHTDSSSESLYGSYSVESTPPASTEQLQVCKGEFSGSSSNYSMYKSNCFSLMVDKCAKTWNAECDQYVNSTNPQQENLFRSMVSNKNIPATSSVSSCVEKVNPVNQSVQTYGAFTRVQNGISYPVSCDKTNALTLQPPVSYDYVAKRQLRAQYFNTPKSNLHDNPFEQIQAQAQTQAQHAQAQAQAQEQAPA